MKEKSYIRVIGISKLIQLIITGCIDISFFLVLFLNTKFRNNIFANKSLTFLCISIWITLLVFLIFMLLDFFYIRQMSAETYELNKKAYLDRLTNIPNRQSLDMLFETHSTPEAIAKMGCGMVRLTNLGKINDSLGREAGDSLLQSFCKLTEEINDSYDFAGRNSGNEFVFVIEDCDQSNYDAFIVKLDSKLHQFNSLNTQCPIEVEVAFTMNSKNHFSILNQLFSSTSEKLHIHDTTIIGYPENLKEVQKDE